ncbi:MAG: hypothetical protein P1U68_13820 [Verrucomicrobiales bacterium]|nr:hypothetical protein [Verrucomicrobiales bacterium]
MEMRIHLFAAGLAGFMFSVEAEEAPPSYEVFELMTASSPNDSRSKDWRPGDGITLEVSGMAWIDDELAISIRKGEVWIIGNPLSKNREEIAYRLFASGLHEPLGLLRDGNDLLVSQRSEITRLQDNDGDGVADAYLTECDGWNVSGNYHAYAYGPERDGQGNLWVTLNLGMGPLANNAVGWRGWGGTIGRDRKFVPKALGMRSPSGLGVNLEGDMFYSDQQGTWIPASPIYHLREGVFYGNQESTKSLNDPAAPFQMSAIPKGGTPYDVALRSSKEFVPPAVWLPYNKMGRSTTDIEVIDEGGKFGPFDGQLLIGEFTNSAVNRVFLEKVDGEYQGACFPFMDGFPAAVVRLSFAPDGSLFVGMTNRGWSSLGNRSYGLSRVSYTDELPFSIREMRARPDGFELVFTEPVDAASLGDAFEMSSYTYLYSSAYGSDEIRTKSHEITDAELSKDGLSVTLRVEGLRPLYVHELSANGLKSVRGRSLDSPKAYYTLNKIPR